MFGTSFRTAMALACFLAVAGTAHGQAFVEHRYMMVFEPGTTQPTPQADVAMQHAAQFARSASARGRAVNLNLMGHADDVQGHRADVAKGRVRQVVSALEREGVRGQWRAHVGPARDLTRMPPGAERSVELVVRAGQPMSVNPGVASQLLRMQHETNMNIIRNINPPPDYLR